ncbi:MAG TPA: peroxidase family protein [Gemmataceae bacterium]|nr:peroxidase family protein [Gemmataceae bacterium]
MSTLPWLFLSSRSHAMWPSGRGKKRRRRTYRPQIESFEARCLLNATVFYSADGSGNNSANPGWGAAGADLLRISPAAYADGISAPSLSQAPSPRAVSNLLNNQADPNNPTQDIQTVDQNSLSDFGYVWGQFIDHDMDLTPANSGESFPIAVAATDPIGTQLFTRSSYDPNTGTSTSNPRQQMNADTSYLDLSQVYGSNAMVADALRTHVGGLLKTSPGNMLPYMNARYFTAAELAALNMANDAQAVPGDQMFATGDVRGNENIELTALQTLFVRNHNGLARQLQREHPGWTDEQLYQEARRLNIAEEQMITYSEWIPAVLGTKALPAYTGYDPTVDASIATEFSTVGFRFGHSLLSNAINRQGNDGLDIQVPGGAPINLAEDFFDPNLLNPNGVVDPLTGQTSSDIGPILKGDADGNSQAMDLLAINEVRNLLFGDGQFGGQDLMARDIQRARDHGIGSYNDVRAAYGLPRLTTFAQITSDVQVQQQLEQAYGDVDKIDPFEGGLAEDHVPGSDVGPLFQAIMVDQFTRLRNGDRLFYLNQSFGRDEQRLLQQGDTLTKVIEANTDVRNLQSDVFLFQASISGTVYDGQYRNDRGGVPGILVELQDAGGGVLAVTRTDRWGRYSFNQLSGPSSDLESASGTSATGYYHVSLVLPPGATLGAPNPSPILIGRGGIAVNGIDFHLVWGGRGSGFGPDRILSGSRNSDTDRTQGETAPPNAVPPAQGTSAASIISEPTPLGSGGPASDKGPATRHVLQQGSTGSEPALAMSLELSAPEQGLGGA